MLFLKLVAMAPKRRLWFDSTGDSYLRHSAHLEKRTAEPLLKQSLKILLTA